MIAKTLIIAAYGFGSMALASSPPGQGAKTAAEPVHRVKPQFTYSERQMRLALFPCADCHRLIEEGKASASGLARKGHYHYRIDYRHFINDNRDRKAVAVGGLGEHHAPTCLVCHDAKDRNQLRLPTSVGGATVSFNESYRQCLSCHGDKTADYHAGIHGKDIGGYGRKQQIRLQCVDCHNPHAPKIPQVTPLRPPVKPATLIPKKAHH